MHTNHIKYGTAILCLAFLLALAGCNGKQPEPTMTPTEELEQSQQNTIPGTVTITGEAAAELTADERARCATKRPAEKRHACLVDWDALDALPQASPGLLKRYDYENVVQLLAAPK